MSRGALGIVVGLGLALLVPAPALGAVTVATDGNRMRVISDGVGDAITLGGDPAAADGQGTASAPDIALAIPDSRCTDSGDTITCTGSAMAPFTAFNALGNGGADGVTIATGQYWAVLGGGGDDSLTGSETNVEQLQGEDGDDKLVARGGGSDQAREGFLAGGDGDDRVEGGPGGEFLQGDSGTDLVLGNGGPDFVSGGFGDGDTVDGGAGPDEILESGDGGTSDSLRGGAGTDRVLYSNGNVGGPSDSFSVDLAAGESRRINNDGGNIVSLTEIEDVLTGDGADRLTGDGGPNDLNASGGNDTVSGGGGSDKLFGGAGSDNLLARDGVQDRVDCGPDNDQASLDEVDTRTGCEPPPPDAAAPDGAPSESSPPAAETPATRDILAPRCTISGLKGRQARRAFVRGVRFRQRCGERYRVEASLLVRVRSIRRGRVIASRPGDLVLGKRRLPLATRARTVRLTVARRLRGRLGRRFTARLKIDTFDAAGNRRTTARKITVR